MTSKISLISEHGNNLKLFETKEFDSDGDFIAQHYSVILYKNNRPEHTQDFDNEFEADEAFERMKKIADKEKG